MAGYSGDIGVQFVTFLVAWTESDGGVDSCMVLIGHWEMYSRWPYTVTTQQTRYTGAMHAQSRGWTWGGGASGGGTCVDV